MSGKDKQNHIFQKSKSYELSSGGIYFSEDREFIIHEFYWCIPLRHEIYTKSKKRSNLIKGVSSHNICSAIKSQHVKKNIYHSVPKTFDFSQNSSVLFHRVTFDHSISCAVLIDKPNESCQNSKIFEKNATSTTKKKLLKRKGNSITPGKTNAPISQTCSEDLKLTTQTYQIRNKELQIKLGQLQEEISKSSLLVSADLSNDFKSIILETEQIKIYSSSG